MEMEKEKITVEQIVADEFVELVSKGKGFNNYFFVIRVIEMSLNCKMQGYDYNYNKIMMVMIK